MPVQVAEPTYLSNSQQVEHTHWGALTGQWPGTGPASGTLHISSIQAASHIFVPQGCWSTATHYLWPVIPPVCSKYMEWEVLQLDVGV
jgi:hypothetical protein